MLRCVTSFINVQCLPVDQRVALVNLSSTLTACVLQWLLVKWTNLQSVSKVPIRCFLWVALVVVSLHNRLVWSRWPGLGFHIWLVYRKGPRVKTQIQILQVPMLVEKDRLPDGLSTRVETFFYMFFLHVCVQHAHSAPAKSRRRHQISCSWTLRAAMLVLWTEPRSYGRAIVALNY